MPATNEGQRLNEFLLTLVGGGALTAFFGGVYKIYTTWFDHKTRESEMAETSLRGVIQQWKDMAERLERENGALEQRLLDARRVFDAQVDGLRSAWEAQAQRMRDDLTVARVEAASLRSRVIQDEIEDRSTGRARSLTDVVITIDERGTVIEATLSIASVFHWLEQDLRGQSIQRLIPRRYRERHQAAFQAALARPEFGGLDHPLAVHGLTREGYETPIEITRIERFPGPKGGWLFSAEIRRREEDDRPSTGDLPVMPASPVVPIVPTPVGPAVPAVLVPGSPQSLKGPSDANR